VVVLFRNSICQLLKEIILLELVLKLLIFFYIMVIFLIMSVASTYPKNVEKKHCFVNKIKILRCLILPAALDPGVYSASNRNEYQKHKNNVCGE
jgi:hypothetical protein